MAARGEDARRLSITERKGVRLALFDYAESLNGHALPEGRSYLVDTLEDEAALFSGLQEAELRADIPICFLRVGQEYSRAPTSRQRSLCERLIDAGADLVICSHPHILQGAERVCTPASAEGVVSWSLGDFASFQTVPLTTLGGAAVVEMEKAAQRVDGGSAVRIRSFKLVPIGCHQEPGLAQPYVIAERIASNLGASR